MSSLAVQDYPAYFDKPRAAIVQSIPTIPELKQWLIRQQLEKTQPYIVSDVWNNAVSVKLGSSISSVSESEQVEIIRNAQTTIRSNVKDIDPDIRALVSKNFKDLLWK